MPSKTIGISGLAAYVPPYRVSLEDWCAWTGNDWEKIRQVVGHSFRMRGPEHNVYTMAANAVLRLIQQYDIDPKRVRFLALGTESSTDNSAGAIIVRGMVDDALRALGEPELARGCEVPEMKHACLGGTYAMKSAIRYLGYDGASNLAIVVSADVAEYARGSSGEPTQGAGAVAMLLETNPTLAAVDLYHSGSASGYRGLDFRKPMVRFCQQHPRPNGQVQDLPVFNGKYSTTCYTDQVLHALHDMFDTRDPIDRVEYFRGLSAVFMHRPYRRMPETAWAQAYLAALAHPSYTEHGELSEYCEAAGVGLDAVLDELRSSPDVFALVQSERLGDDAYPNTALALKIFKNSPRYAEVVDAKMRLGAHSMMDLGNLYSAALPAWIAAGFEEAADQRDELAGTEMLTLGYGSGDAAEAIPLRVCETWRSAAKKIGFRKAISHGVDLNQTQYETMHDHGELTGVGYEPVTEFILDRVGERTDHQFNDSGIEYYRFVN